MSLLLEEMKKSVRPFPPSCWTTACWEVASVLKSASIVKLVRAGLKSGGVRMRDLLVELPLNSAAVLASSVSPVTPRVGKAVPTKVAWFPLGEESSATVAPEVSLSR